MGSRTVEDDEPIIETLRLHRKLLNEHEEEDTSSPWVPLEHYITAHPPVIHTREGLIACLGTAMHFGCGNEFIEALVGASLKYVTEACSDQR